MPILSNISLIPPGTNAPSAIVYEIFTGAPGISSLHQEHQEHSPSSARTGFTCIGSCRPPIVPAAQQAFRGLACRPRTLTWTHTSAHPRLTTETDRHAPLIIAESDTLNEPLSRHLLLNAHHHFLAILRYKQFLSHAHHGLFASLFEGPAKERAYH